VKAFRFFFSASVIIFCAAAASAQTVKADFDRQYNFSKLKSFAFLEQRRSSNDVLAANPLVDERIKRNLENQLIANGFQKDSSGNPDFVIAYYATAKERTKLVDNSMYGVFGRVRRLDIKPEAYIEGTLVVDFVDRPANKLIWRGYAGGSVEPKKSEKHILTATQKLVKEFVKDGKPAKKA
jgi:uncharacterized protein YfaA (DUF2138 family)